MEARLNKKLFKIEVLLLKIITVLIAGLHFINTLFGYFNYNNTSISFIGSAGLLALLFIYIASFTHGFCLYHRLFIYYVALNNIICFIDYNYEIPIFNRSYFYIHFLIGFLFLVSILYLKFKVCKKR